MAEYTAVVKKEGDWWIDWIEEVPGINCQEATREELLETLRVTLLEALEFNRQEARAAAGSEFEEERIAAHSRRTTTNDSSTNHSPPWRATTSAVASR